MLVLLDEDGVQSGAEIFALAEAGRLDGRHRVEHRAWADGQAGGAQSAGEMQDVLGQRALALAALRHSTQPLARSASRMV